MKVFLILVVFVLFLALDPTATIHDEICGGQRGGNKENGECHNENGEGETAFIPIALRVLAAARNIRVTAVFGRLSAAVLSDRRGREGGVALYEGNCFTQLIVK